MPARKANNAASVSGNERAQVTIRPAETSNVAIPGVPISPAMKSPGSSWLARTGSSANFAGSTVFVHAVDQQ